MESANSPVGSAARGGPEGIDALLPLDEAMRILGIGRTLLYKQMSNGELPWVQIGSTRHIRSADLIDFINRNRKGGWRVA